MSTSKIVTLDALTLYHQQMKEYVDTEDDKGAGLNVEGESFDVSYNYGGSTLTRTMTAQTGAEVFNYPSGKNKAVGLQSHAEGCGTKAVSICSHAEGYNTQAGIDPDSMDISCSHAEGFQTKAYGQYSHAEGCVTTAWGQNTHAEGYNTQANAPASHAEGMMTQANGQNSHAEGQSTIAEGYCSHTEGESTKAVGYASHAEGQNTIASTDYSHAMGKFNRTSNTPANFAFVIGNGTSDSSRSDAFAIDWDGKVYVGNSTTGIDISTLVHETITEDDIDALFV